MRISLWPVLHNSILKVLKTPLLMSLTWKDFATRSEMMLNLEPVKSRQIMRKMFKSQEATHKSTLLKPVICFWKWIKKDKFSWTPTILMWVLVLQETSQQSRLLCWLLKDNWRSQKFNKLVITQCNWEEKCSITQQVFVV